MVRRLQYDWQDLAGLFGVPVERARFGRGDEPTTLGESLEIRGRLPELANALDELGRTDLANVLHQHPA